MILKNFLFGIISLAIMSGCSNNTSKTDPGISLAGTPIEIQEIDLPTGSWGVPLESLSYNHGIGDLNGDGQMDFVIVAWDEYKWKHNYFAYAYLSDGKFLWELDLKSRYKEKMTYEPCALVALCVWDMDGDGKDEVITNIQDDLVMLDGMTGSVKKRVKLPDPAKLICSAIAFLDGKNPYVILAFGRDIRVLAFDREFNLYWKFDEEKYKDSHTSRLYTWDIDNDGRDEVVNGPVLLNEDGTVYFGELVGRACRSFIHDIDPENPGYEWYVPMTPSEGYYGSEEMLCPRKEAGPYLIDVDQKKILWHYGGDPQFKIGWSSRMHRGWITEFDINSPGLEMWLTGVYWEGDEYQRYQTGDFTDPKLRPNVRKWAKYRERDFIYSAKGKIIQKLNHHVAYPVQWDDDPDYELFFYRQGFISDKFCGPTLVIGLPQAFNSGESVQADVRGDYREEIIVASRDKLYIISNASPTIYPDRPSPRNGHNYMMNIARIGSGLPKPQPFDPDYDVFAVSK